MIRAFVTVAAIAALAACVPKGELDSAKAEAERLKAQIVQLEQVSSEQKQRIEELERGNSEMKTKLAKKPQMPVSVTLRQALLGGSQIVVFSTTVKQDFPVLVTVKSHSLGTSQRFRVNLSSIGTTELGKSEGASIEVGDELTLENQNFETTTLQLRK